MGFYETKVFPLINDVVMSSARLGRLRDETLAIAKGRVLELGLGTGLNIPRYPAGVTALVGIDPNPGMNARAAKRAKAAPFPVEVRGLAGEKLDLPDASFDTVTSTFVFCTIADPAKALAEVKRVLKPGGSLLLLEHGKSDSASTFKWQQRLNPIQRVVACGCELDRDIRAIVERAGFEWTALRTWREKKMPRTHGFLYLGAAKLNG